MEVVLSLAIGVLAASGIWLILRPRTFQVITGLALLSYAVNLFIFSMGRLTEGAPPSTRTPASDGTWPLRLRFALLPAPSRIVPPFSEMPVTAMPSASLSLACTV